MNTVLFLVLFPLATAGLLLLAGKREALRGPIVKVAALVLCSASAVLLWQNLDGSVVLFHLDSPIVDRAMTGLELLLSLVLLVIGLRGRQLLVILLVLAQTALVVATEFLAHPRPVETPIFVDSFSVLMALIIGIVGGLICIHAVGYMRDYHAHHPEMPDARRSFFITFFVFLGAMFGLVFANHLGWLFLCWEVTTLCSYLLIGYSRTDEARANAFLALRLNLLGGLGFAGALYYQAHTGGTMALLELAGAGAGVALLPAILISFAGLTKAAQMPFSSWLLGAMVAPTPVSALLHSSTMVKAGVYVIIRFAPALQHTVAGLMLAFVGAVTFLLASCIAISQSNAKRVLAYSTIANLGLIVCCAGVGNAQAVWAAILLVVFHAVSKALLFLAVGTAEHRIDSRDIEDMEGLIVRLPRVALAILIGIAGMFLAPFGMLISKWAAIEALIAVNPLLPVLVAFGSSATLFFWAKWMGKLLATGHGEQTDAGASSGEEQSVLLVLAVLTVGLCAAYPAISAWSINPCLQTWFGETVTLGRSTVLITSIMLALVAALPLSLLYHGGRNLHLSTPYLGGANVADRTRFVASVGGTRAVGSRNYYLSAVFGEGKLTRVGLAACCVLLVAMFAGTL